MMRTFLLSIVLIFSVELQACIISPSARVAMHSDEIRAKADIVFFGKVTKIYRKNTGEQTATFRVIKSYKGEMTRDIVIKNEVLSSCFVPFQTIDSAYYIFATKIPKSAYYEITSSSSNGFISLEDAIAYSWDIK